MANQDTLNFDSSIPARGRAEVRAQTLQQKFGFRDDELATAQHDDIVLWLDSNMTTILPQILRVKRSWGIDLDQANTAFEQYRRGCLTVWQKRWAGNTDPRTESTFDPAESYYQDRLDLYQKRIAISNDGLAAIRAWTLPNLPPAPGIVIQDKRWEHAISTDRGFVVGFVDMRVTYEADGCLELRLPAASGGNQYYWEQTAMVKELTPAWQVSKDGGHVCFEVKSHIKSAGELIRQVRLYQEYVRDRFVIVSPDTRFVDILRAQGIGFIEYPGETA